MMTFNTGKSVFAAIERIAATSSKNEKEELIKAAGQSSTLFMKAVTYAYDPFKNYGVGKGMAPTKTPGLAPGGNDLNEPWVWKMLDDLASRALSGNSAREKIQNTIDLLDDPSAEVLRRIINRDMRAGFTDGTINRVFKGTIAEFPYMRCSLPDKSNMGKWDWSVGIFSQEKADGMFANVNLDDKGYLWVTSRQGSQFPAGCLEIDEDLINTLDFGTQTHGELLVYEAGVLMPREKGNGVLNHLLEGGKLELDQRIVYVAWDQIPLSAVVPGGKYDVPYATRFKRLAIQGVNAQRSGIVSFRVVPTKIVKSKADAYAHYRDLLKDGKEGTIVKHPAAIWKDTTSKDQVKLKLEFEVDLRIKGFVPGTPGTKNEATFGALLCESECGRLRVGVSGFTDAMRLKIHNERDRYLDTIVAVKANDVMAPDEEDELHSLFLPRVAEFRTDKTVADDLERVLEIQQAAIEGREVKELAAA